ncbi:hypothetical protein SAMN02745883_00773 [Caminicella sporogenes DSM 14501]|uniref:Uncharacterized protein n=1 Tax=Caminicella sporogenes DSM 14501 TaxID=1121266 RepID=A0A1M6N2X6_9FIRM|nr:hypothetical protein [Caminicella sporogenes]RKD22384.1 hypothetical protein BET04_04950 [Caminicella sporogenes]SHJ90032.1 hypothetical protein SAMN02745883_00773 [Caminicella sporogenes DSM 14501]
MNYKDNRPNLFNKFIYFDAKPSYDNKAKAFWHIASIGEDDLKNENNQKYDMDPCCNDVANGIRRFLKYKITILINKENFTWELLFSG